MINGKFSAAGAGTAVAVVGCAQYLQFLEILETFMLTIGDLSRRTGVKVPTIRYYEQMGLLDAAERSEGNQRRYGRAERERLSFIKHARDLGLAIGSIRELIELSSHPDQPCAQADRIAREQLAAVRQKIARLRRLEQELERISAHCDGAHQIRDCQVIQALANHDLCDGEH